MQASHMLCNQYLYICLLNQVHIQLHANLELNCQNFSQFFFQENQTLSVKTLLLLIFQVNKWQKNLKFDNMRKYFTISSTIQHRILTLYFFMQFKFLAFFQSRALNLRFFDMGKSNTVIQYLKKLLQKLLFDSFLQNYFYNMRNKQKLRIQQSIQHFLRNHSTQKSHMKYHLEYYDQQRNQGSLPVTLHNSNEVSFEQPQRKYSMASLNQIIDIDKVMVDIKLTPLKYSEVNEKVKIIYQCLEFLKKTSPIILEEIRTVQLVIENIQHKLINQCSTNNADANANSKKYNSKSISNSQTQSYQQRKESLRSSKSTLKDGISNSNFQELSKKTPSKRQSERTQPQQSKRKQTSTKNILNAQYDISPIKQLQQMTSRIVYTNFSIKQIETNSKMSDFDIQISPQPKGRMANPVGRRSSDSDIKSISNNSKPKLSKQPSNTVFTVSKFDPEDEEIEKLNKNIQALDKVLQQKGLNLRSSVYKGKTNDLKMQQKQSDKKKNIFSKVSQKKSHTSSCDKQNWM